MRVEATVGVHAGVEHQANVVGVCENAVHEAPGHLAEFFFAFGVPEKILAAFVDAYVGVHAVAVYTDDRLWQKAGGEPHFSGDLATD